MSQIRTSLIIGAAIGIVAAAILMSPSAPAPAIKLSRTEYGMTVSSRLVTSRILVGAHEHNLAVSITAHAAHVRSVVRPSLSLAIVIDRSGSMRGSPLEHAKAAALSMLRQLDSRDAFSVVTYSSGSEVVIPMQHATDANKAAARGAIETIDEEGGTCVSCGIESGTYQAVHSPLRDGLRRILVISDGQANEGIHDRDELAALAANKAATGVSISTVGVGLAFDESTMRRLAEVGRGNYYFVEDTVSLSTLLTRELTTLNQTVASEVLIAMRPGPGTRVEEVYGYPMTRGSNDEVLVPVADMRAGETRKVVFRVNVAAADEGPIALSQIELRWRDLSDGTARIAHTTAEAEVVDDPSAVAASIDRATMQAVERALSARALEEAAAAYDRTGITGAKQVLERRSQPVRANARYLDHDTVDALEAASGAAIEGFTNAPEKAKKTTSVKAYELAR